MTLDTKSASTDCEISQLFNEFFHSVFSQSHTPLKVSSPSTDETDTIDDFSITVTDVFKCLSGLDAQKSCGIDGIPPVLLKSCAVSLCEPVHHLLCQCIHRHYLPEEWRTHSCL